MHSLALTYNNHFYNKCFPHDKRAMLDRRVHSHRRNIADSQNAISYRLLTNRNDPVLFRLFCVLLVAHANEMK